jgi:hypothetical protein
MCVFRFDYFRNTGIRVTARCAFILDCIWWLTECSPVDNFETPSESLKDVHLYFTVSGGWQSVSPPVHNIQTPVSRGYAKCEFGLHGIGLCARC